MIIFDLTCSNNHFFEGWFQSQEDFDVQLEKGLIGCPNCGSIEIRRVPSAVHLTKTASTSMVSSDLPVIHAKEDITEAYQRLISAIMSSSEDVGAEFADEARRIYYREVPERAIRGQTSKEDFKALLEEGIEVMKLPIIKKGKMN